MNRAFVNEPKNAPMCGAAVASRAPHASGTIIRPPGNRSIVALIFI